MEKLLNPKIDEKELPLIGKTFSLYGDTLNSDEYYRDIREIADELLKKCNDKYGIIELLDNLSRKKQPFKKYGWISNELISEIIKYSSRLSKYTYPAKYHLANISFRQKFDKTIRTTEEQYHLYMIEIELVNMFNAESFKKADIKLAFLPHCLHDLDKNCLSKKDGVDYICGKCSKECFINSVTRLLNSHNIQAYIWMEANLKSLFKKLKAKNKKVAVMGVACIAELMNGMRMCMKYDIPVIGVPLDANRCSRWMSAYRSSGAGRGEFYKTSVNLKKVEELIRIEN